MATASPPARIALVTTTLAPGGAERCLVRIATGLDRARFAPRFYSLQAPPSHEQGQLVAELMNADVPVHFCHAHGVWDAWRVAEELRERFVAERIDLVQTFLFHANFLGAFAGWRAGGPPVVMGLRAEEPSWLRRTIGAWGANWAARVTCVSQSVADAARAAGIPSEKLVVIPNGIDPTPYDVAARDEGALAATGLPPERKWLLAVGRLDEQKGFDWLLAEVAPKLLARLPDYDLAIVGEGPQRAELERLRERSGLAPRIHLLGWRGDVPALLASAALLLLPSRWEGMPNVVLEAMAARRPVVATDVAGVRELLGPLADKEVSVLGDAKVFVERSVAIGSQPELARSLGEQNRARVEAQFTIPKMVAAYEEIFSGVLESP